MGIQVDPLWQADTKARRDSLFQRVSVEATAYLARPAQSRDRDSLKR